MMNLCYFIWIGEEVSNSQLLNMFLIYIFMNSIGYYKSTNFTQLKDCLRFFTSYYRRRRFHKRHLPYCKWYSLIKQMMLMSHNASIQWERMSRATNYLDWYLWMWPTKWDTFWEMRRETWPKRNKWRTPGYHFMVLK